MSGGEHAQYYPCPAFETQDYGWIDGNQQMDSHGFKVPNLPNVGMADMAGYAALDSSMTSNTLPRSMKFNHSNALQRVPSHVSDLSVQTKHYGWLDSKENIAEDQRSLKNSQTVGHHLQQSQSTGTLPNMKKKVSFKDFS